MGKGSEAKPAQAVRPAAAQVARIHGAEHQFALRMIGNRDAEAVIEQLDLNAHVGPGVAHDIPHELRDDCARYLEDHMVPKLVEFRASLPKTESGKISRRLVAEGVADSQGEMHK